MTFRADLQWIPDVHRDHRDSWLCHEAWSEPPQPPVPLRRFASLPAGKDRVLDAEDGSRFRVHLAGAGVPSDAVIVIAPDFRGLHPFYVRLTERFADAGIHAVAFDYFGRSYGTAVPPPSFYEGPTNQASPFYEHMQRTSPERIQADVRVTSGWARAVTGARRVFLTGFCMGGRVAFNAAAEQEGLSGVVGFYGRVTPRTPEDRDAPIDRAARTKTPVLGLFGGADPGIPRDAIDAYGSVLATAGVPHELVSYPGAPHSFFDIRFAAFARECDDAWTRVLAFLRSGNPAAR